LVATQQKDFEDLSSVSEDVRAVAEKLGKKLFVIAEAVSTDSQDSFEFTEAVSSDYQES
jgi:hypothetical protein